MTAGRRSAPLTEFVRWAWGQLTSMRTALLLLFLLALATIPGSMIPQTTVSPITVLDFKREYPGWDKILEPLGMYHVYTSPAFSAVYLLLFVSLIGCILPRVAKYARAVRKPPPQLPARIERLPETATGALIGGQAEALEGAASYLRSKRYRVRRFDTGISAERGYSREAGNLVFHISLVVVLLGLAWSNLLGFHGTSVVVEGRGFTNSITQFDDFTSGPLLDTDNLEPFSIDVNQFHAEFEMGEVQHGAARRFDADVVVHDAAGSREQQMTVNRPVITAGGTQVNLQGHGYAPSFTVRDGNGDIAFAGPIVFLPQDGNFASIGIIKVPDARPKRLAFEAFFYPTAMLNENGPQSVFPDAFNPEVYLNAWVGEPAEETGIPESVYTLNTTGLQPVLGDGEERLRAALPVGGGMTLPDGLGSITFDGWQRWVKLQVSDTPGNLLTLIAISLGVLGLSISLAVRPRRLFVRVADGVVTVGGLDRADAASGLADEVAALLTATGSPSVDDNDEATPPNLDEQANL